MRMESSANITRWVIGIVAVIAMTGLQAAPAAGQLTSATPDTVQVTFTGVTAVVEIPVSSNASAQDAVMVVPVEVAVPSNVPVQEVVIVMPVTNVAAPQAELAPTGLTATVEVSVPSNVPVQVVVSVAPVVAPTPTNVPVLKVEPAVSEATVPSPAPDTVGSPEMVDVPGFAVPNQTEERISVSLDDVPLQDVVRMFTRISGANIIATATNLGGKVTVNLQDVEWKPALSSILDIYNMQISEKIPGSGIYSVMPKAIGAEDPMVSATIFLSNASVSNIAVLIAPLLMRGGTVSPFPNCNALVVRSTALNVNDIRKVITEIDLPRKQVYIEAKFLELDDSAIKDLGINWQMLEGYNVGAGNLSWSVEETRNKTKSRADTLTRSDSRTRTDALTQSLDANGNVVSQDKTTVTRNPVSGDIESTETVTTPTRSVDDSVNQSLNVQRNLVDSFDKTVKDVRTALLTADDFKVVLSALKQMNGVSVVSNPKIIVANEQTATIHIGENEPNIKGTVTPGQQGQANTTTYELDDKKPYFEFGIKLDVTPTINNSSNITVTINPTLSRFVRNKVTPDNNSFPVEATKTIRTTFALESGRTAAIGGLTETTDSKQEIKIPLLGDIPLIGKYLFSYTHDAREQKETIIFVTVGIAEPGHIERNDGLPEDADLVHRHLARMAKLAKAAATNVPPAVLTNGVPVAVPVAVTLAPQ